MSYVVIVEVCVFCVTSFNWCWFNLKKKTSPPTFCLTQGKLKLWNNQFVQWPRKVVVLAYGTGNNRIGFKARLRLISEFVSRFVITKPESEWRFWDVNFSSQFSSAHNELRRIHHGKRRKLSSQGRLTDRGSIALAWNCQAGGNFVARHIYGVMCVVLVIAQLTSWLCSRCYQFGLWCWCFWPRRMDEGKPDVAKRSVASMRRFKKRRTIEWQLIPTYFYFMSIESIDQ